MKVFVYSTGCEQRQLDAERVLRYADRNSLSITADASEAERLVLFTCGVDTNARQRSLRQIASWRAAHPETPILVGGCLPAIEPEAFSVYENLSFVDPKTLAGIERLTEETVPLSMIPIPNTSSYDEETVLITTPREAYESAKRGFKIRIAQGCEGSCTYCVIKDAMGTVESESIESILSQVEIAKQEDVASVMLMAGDTGAYGRDRSSSFPELLTRILRAEGEFSIHIHDFNVNWIANDPLGYARAFSADTQRRIQTVCLPTQSGSDDILQLMGRQYTATEALGSIHWMQTGFPWIAQGTHTIVGFPGETEDDFQETLTFLEKANFSFITAFAYSEHPRAAAAKLPEKVAEETIKRRLTKLKEHFSESVKVLS